MIHKPRIPFSRSPVDFESVAPLFKEAIDNGWLTTGPLVERFNSGLKNYWETDNVVLVSSCTAALQIALKALDLKHNDEVIIPAMTFIATLEAIELSGLTPVLADIDPLTWNISVKSIEQKISPWTKAIIAVAFAGNPPAMQELRKLADKHNLKLILDNAHALEAKFDGKFLHHYADFSCYSFYATKNLTTAEGGAIICSKEDMERVRALSLHGMSRNAWNRYAGGTWRYDIVETGFKANLTDIHAAIGIAQLGKIETHHKRRLELIEKYGSGLKGLPIRFQGLEGLVSPNGHAAHLFSISIAPQSIVKRDTLIEELQKNSIAYSVHFIPLPEFSTVQKKYNFKPEDYPHSYEYFSGALSLPLYPQLKDSEVDEIIKVIRSLFAENAVTSAV
ncbi:MAG: UDP-4-amino-4-deoxy-L-arabinose--oxoglutarate aminotransferase [Turneriella sp.]|nr:UDP-4-amino-4-deoxy-L-arabinose--oxoglutarate aminotransferase [Turneriella sp.]